MKSKWHEVPLRDLVGYISKGIAPSYADDETDTEETAIFKQEQKKETIELLEL